jgi:hypothetical protein
MRSSNPTAHNIRPRLALVAVMGIGIRILAIASFRR